MSEFVQIGQMSIVPSTTREQQKALKKAVSQAVDASILAADPSNRESDRGRKSRVNLPRKLSRAHSRSKSSELKKVFVPPPIEQFLSKERIEVKEQHFEIPEYKYH